ncbi:MAG: ATP-binding cassette domain-containing protein [Desulfuromonadaceae bacterium]
MTLLNIRELQVRKGGYEVLRGLDLTLEQGEIHALIGTNGTGKSTLAAAIMGCKGVEISGGALEFDGTSLLGLDLTARAKLGISLAWQEPARFEGLSVAHYLTLKKGPRSAGQALELVGLEPSSYLSRQVDASLSGGERKRIELASLLTLPLRLAILDEPDSGIDLLSTQGIINVVRDFRLSGTAVLLITHRNEISHLADRASQICFGKIIYSGAPDAVAEHYLGRRCQRCNGQECDHEST